MIKKIKEEKEYRIIETNDIKSIGLAKSTDTLTMTDVYAVDISFGDYGIFVGRYEDENKANEILEEIKSFLNNDELQEYIVKNEKI